MTSPATAVHADPIDGIERGLALLVRQATLPRTHTRLATAAGVNLDRSAYYVLFRLGERGALRLSELAEELGVDPSTASRQVADLERSRLVSRQSDRHDGRAVRLGLSAEGSRVLRKLRKARRQLVTGLVDDWPDGDKAEFARLLGRLAERYSQQD